MHLVKKKKKSKMDKRKKGHPIPNVQWAVNEWLFKKKKKEMGAATRGDNSHYSSYLWSVRPPEVTCQKNEKDYRIFKLGSQKNNNRGSLFSYLHEHLKQLHLKTGISVYAR